MKLHTNMKKDYFIANKNDSLETIIKKLFINSNRGLVVIDQKKVVGVIAAGDILESLVYKKNMNATASSIMNKSFKFLRKKDMKLAAKIFAKQLHAFIPIVNIRMELIDIITLDYFLKHFSLKKNK